MKQLLLVVIILSFFTACEETPKNPVAEYGNTMMNAYQKGKIGGKIANLQAVKSAVQAYHAANDRFPEKLEDVKDLIGSEMDFSKYNYNPQTGMVSLKSY
jgi:hypothetical protein